MVKKVNEKNILLTHCTYFLRCKWQQTTFFALSFTKDVGQWVNNISVSSF